MLDSDDFYEFERKVQGGTSVDELTYHGGGHLGVGDDLGIMGNVYSSAGDPSFYLHHANLDRLWNKWQQRGNSFLFPWYFFRLDC